MVQGTRSARCTRRHQRCEFLLGDNFERATEPVHIFLSSQCSLRSDASDGGTRHLALVFFDVLLLDSRPLTGLPYHQRRKIMESIVLPIPGFSLLAERSPIDLTKGIHPASAQLKSVLARVIADHQEGLVLKANEGAYIKSPWVKVHSALPRRFYSALTSIKAEEGLHPWAWRWYRSGDCWRVLGKGPWEGITRHASEISCH